MTQIATTYAQALYDLAKDEQLTEPICAQLQALQAGFAAEPDFVRLLSSHSLPKEQRCGILEDSFRDQVHTYVLSFLKILVEKDYVRHFSECCKAYKIFYNQDHGILPVQAVTAAKLTDDQARRLTEKLEKLTGKTVELENRVDASVLGGVRLDYDGKRVDGTVKNRLDAIGALLKNTVL